MHLRAIKLRGFKSFPEAVEVRLEPGVAVVVGLLFDNEDGALPELDFSEISVTRRLHRGGEGQYLINRAPVRRTDLVELLADVGPGR